MKTSQTGIDLIKEFEGIELTAYPDPGSGGEPYTIGYGHTGGVRPGETITQEKAEELLRIDLRRFELAVEELVKVKLSQPEFDALVSFTFNVGEGAFGSSSLLRRLNAGEPRCTVYHEEMPRWNKGANGPMAGLQRRREAEAEMACQGAFVKAVDDQEDCFMVRAARHFNEEPHQKAAWEWLEAAMDDVTLEEFKARYRASQAPVVERPPLTTKFPLDVPYYGQYDSRGAMAERMCFSSSMAMAIEYLDPEAIDGDDDDYLRMVLKYGDTVSADAQVKAARALGVPCEFHTDGTQAMLEQLLDEGVPVPIGILHHGHVSKPTGGGHWVTLIGYSETHFMVHDPAGELDLVNGGYPRRGEEHGKNQRYSKKDLMRRWLIASDSDGWLVEFA